VHSASSQALPLLTPAPAALSAGNLGFSLPLPAAATPSAPPAADDLAPAATAAASARSSDADTSSLAAAGCDVDAAAAANDFFALPLEGAAGRAGKSTSMAQDGGLRFTG